MESTRSPLVEGLTGERNYEPEIPELCKIDTLQDTPLFVGGSRDPDRVRLIKYTLEHPEGVPLPKVVRDVFGKKGPVNAGDRDYQLARRFYTENEDYFDTYPQNGQTTVAPHLRLLDLISEGITQKRGQTNFLTDREFCKSLLSSTSSLNQRGKDVLAQSLQKYVNRIEDYVMLFEVEDLRTGSRSQFTKPCKTRFNDLGRIRQQWARFNGALDYALENFSNAVLCTLTTDPKRFSDLLSMIEAINHNFNSLMSWMDYKPQSKPSSRPGYRPDYIKALEFTEDGKPHLHILFFDVPTREDGMPWLIDKQELSDKWSDLGQGRIVDFQPLEYRSNLGEQYSKDSGFVAWNNYVPDKMLQEFTSGQTAGQYLGKYLSAMFGGVIDLATSETFEAAGAYEDKTATYKLALYWATNRRMWSLSRSIEEAIAPEDDCHLSLPVKINHIGTYRYWDLPLQTIGICRDFVEVEDLMFFSGRDPIIDVLGPP